MTSLNPTWRALLGWLLAGALACAMVAWAMKTASRAQLRADAEHSALQWASYVRDTVPELDSIFAGDPLTPASIEQLSRLRHLGEVFRFKLYDPHGRELLVSEQLGLGAEELARARAAAPLDTLARSPEVRDLVLGGRSIVYLRRSQRADRPGVYSEAYIPVQGGNGNIGGVVEVYVDQADRSARIASAFLRVAIAVVAALALLLGLSLRQWMVRTRRERQAEDQVRYLAEHDPLTGLMNRASFNAALSDAEARSRAGGPKFAVLCLDLDHFKLINDTHGQAVGDACLGLVATRLREVVRQFDLVARLGGDEFAILQSGVRGSEDVSSFAQRVVDVLAAPHDIGERRVEGGASVGAAIYGTDGSTRDELLHKADLALYRAKADGRGQFSFYDAAMDADLQLRRALVHDLRHAIADDQLTLHFQPLFEAEALRLSGYEALARWSHPDRGAISPAEFIPLAEQAGLIEPLGRWVLLRACEEAVRWPSQLDVSVNLSAAQFQGDLVGVVSECLMRSGLAPQRLQLEITESLLMRNTEQVLQTLRTLQALGARIVMDDFGTGYSSLAYLWRFPFHKVKIDRAFTQNMERDPKVDLIVGSIVSLSHALGMKVNAEGAETASQLARLRAHGCDEIQGFLLGRPVPAHLLRHDDPQGWRPTKSGPRMSTLDPVI
ncbi:EAL domain-containing protein [Rhizobacter sp. SG703]|uniref:putative bifunctional diguanylate cyclase/phosphodiesterase n=1 Tax=Rhizobacter sp. SG703 TaxID=2587140 RepID=UPI0014459944|nr:EAL domain-containing protein [Rhizobacter sp. SG703]NKI96657.1 diguanylate cyclase (GGDEF)-like protein [Rhizobacter sp. SG703]